MESSGIGFIPQNTVQWMEQRRGKITSSEVYRLMGEPKSKADKEAGELSETGKKYILELIADEIAEPNIGYEGEAILWGRMYEPIARVAYEKRNGGNVDLYGNGYKVNLSGFIDLVDYGGSPDGLTLCDVGGPGVIEIKCPFETHNHLTYCLINEFSDLPPQYYWQCVMNTFITKSEWCDFISFDPRIDHEIGLFIKRGYRGEMDFIRLKQQIDKGIAYKNKIKTLLGLTL